MSILFSAISFEILSKEHPKISFAGILEYRASGISRKQPQNWYYKKISIWYFSQYHFVI